MSWLFSQALVESLEGICSDGEPSAQLNVKPTPHKFWRNDKTMEFSDLSRFGLTLQLLTGNRGEELLTLFLEGFRAKTFHAQGKELELTVIEVDCGQKWQELLARLDHSTSLWKTAQCSLFEDLEQSLEIWPRWGSMRNGVCFHRPMLMETYYESESGLLPSIRKSGQSRAHKCYNREDYHGNLEEYLGRKGYEGLISPLFYEGLMRFPIGWTDVSPLEIRKMQEWLQQHSQS